MSISALMRTSASGMNAQSNRLGTVADNIANVNTTGYKRASAEFSSFIPTPATSDYVSGSVTTHIRHAISEQGNLNGSTSVTDMAISGNGFFIVADPDGTPFLTRAGSFVKNGDGELVNAAGFYLLGYPLDQGTPAVVANGTAGLERVTVSDLALQAVPSTTGTFTTNLPADASIVAAADLPSTNAATAEFTAKTSLVAFADLGREVTLDIYWAKSANETWEISVYDRAEAAAGGGFPYASGPLATDTLTFDPTTGALLPASPTSLTVPVPGGSNLVLDLSQTSQLATDYTVVNAEVNGNGPSAVDRIEIDKAGILYAIYQNGARVPTFQIPLATVASPDNLQPQAGDTFTVTSTSGDLLIGFPTQAGFGSMNSNSLEQSTVDLADQLTDMIEAERHYSVNSKVFQTGADLLDVLVNLKR
jgi:flagellar hook protein FlgE